MPAPRLAESIVVLRAPWIVKRFDKGTEIKSRKEFWAGKAPTRKGSAARAMVVEKYIQRIEGATRIGTRPQGRRDQ